MVILRYLRRMVFYGGLAATFCIPAAYRIGYKKGVLDATMNNINHNYSEVKPIDVKDIFDPKSYSPGENPTQEKEPEEKKPEVKEKPKLEELFAK